MASIGTLRSFGSLTAFIDTSHIHGDSAGDKYWEAINVNVYKGRELVTNANHCLSILRQTRPNDWISYEGACPDFTLFQHE